LIFAENVVVFTVRCLVSAVKDESLSANIITTRARSAPWGVVVLNQNKFSLVGFCLQLGIQASAGILLGSRIGDEIEVWVEAAHPRDDVLSLKHVPIE